MRHFLKILPTHFQPVHDRMKRAELRKDDRVPAFARHDLLVLQEWDGEFTGREVGFLITHAARGEYIPKGLALLSGERTRCSCCDGTNYLGECMECGSTDLGLGCPRCTVECQAGAHGGQNPQCTCLKQGDAK